MVIMIAVLLVLGAANAWRYVRTLEMPYLVAALAGVGMALYSIHRM